MIVQVNENSQKTIQNPDLASYAQRYLRIAEGSHQAITQTGIELSPVSCEPGIAARRQHLCSLGANFRNDGKSVVANRISPACEACQTGVGSATFFISLRCHRTCFYCFNPNQEGYDHHREHLRNPAKELEQLHAARTKIHTLALTGGEPLLFKDRVYDFFRAAERLYPAAHTRLYTCGDHADEETLKELQAVGLDEIRFSIRLHDSAQGHRHVFERIALAMQYIPHVMVEMPVFPGSFETMKGILLELEKLEIHSINLLELCYPFGNAEAFKERGFTVRNPPHHIVYDYWYAGGLPIDGSEEVCLELVAFALENGLKIGVHYCSLENKHTGQLYQQNVGQTLPSTTHFSQKDYFLKSAKVFGREMKAVMRAFRKQNFDNYTINRDYRFVEFPVSQIPELKDLNVEIGISSSVIEYRAGEQVIRELKVDLTTPQQFDLAHDV